MNIYFVRHGETEYNRKGIHQHPDVPLSETGKRQIHKTAEELKKFPVTKIITSDLDRAKTSAAIIGAELGLPIEVSELFREVRRPSTLFNKHHISLATLFAGMGILYHLEDSEWHYADEENIFDVRARVEKSVAFLEALKSEHHHIIVVSHALIINLFVKYMCAYKAVRRRDYLLSIIAAKRLSNASITELAYNDDGNSKTCDWICTSQNNVAHLTKQ